MLKRALRAFRSDELSSEDGIRWLWLACRTAMDLWEDDSWFVLSARQIQLARDAGALTVLPLALNLRAGILLFAGEFAAAETLSDGHARSATRSQTRTCPMPACSSPLGAASRRRRHG